ncbi:unnamed protein product [Echinostoma caproni]|uniref:Uncharacterized protein n=1 Tax=Echinostoma caproni TaxID=27848 RepID=A0A183ASS6_9TREM|nr:unnamed protein product [Echinostoma caproni]
MNEKQGNAENDRQLAIPESPDSTSVAVPRKGFTSKGVLHIAVRTSVVTKENGVVDSVLLDRDVHYDVPLDKAHQEKVTVEPSRALLALPEVVPAEKIDNADQQSQTVQSLASCEHRSVQSDHPSSQVSVMNTHKTSKLIIMPFEQKVRPVPEEVLSQSSATTPSSTSSSHQSFSRRSSLDWNQRVSINTPTRRVSEHEVNWIEPTEPSESSSSSSPESDVELDIKTRPSIIVNMDNSQGKRISISLAKLREDMKEYLSQEDA